MRYNDNYASATANVSTPKSDTATSRDYFIGRLRDARCPKNSELQELFHLNVDNAPKTYKELIETIKDGKYTIDKKIEAKFAALEDGEEMYRGMTYGIIWDGPKADWKGYNDAEIELEKQAIAARDAIMAAATAGDMKAAVDAFEAWTPTVQAS